MNAFHNLAQLANILMFPASCLHLIPMNIFQFAGRLIVRQVKLLLFLNEKSSLYLCTLTNLSFQTADLFNYAVNPILNKICSHEIIK